MCLSGVGGVVGRALFFCFLDLRGLNGVSRGSQRGQGVSRGLKELKRGFQRGGAKAQGVFKGMSTVLVWYGIEHLLVEAIVDERS